MDPRIITNALAFLERVQLTGGETPAFIEVINTLRAELPPDEAQQDG